MQTISCSCAKPETQTCICMLLLLYTHVQQISDTPLSIPTKPNYIWEVKEEKKKKTNRRCIIIIAVSIGKHTRQGFI